MGRLYCKCLNTKIGHTNDLAHNARVTKIEELCSSVPTNLAGKQLIEIQQDIGGIVVEHPVLSQVYAVNDWNVHHCSNCSTDVYLSHSVKQDKIFVFKGLVVDPSPLVKSSNYSKVFSIILNENGDQDLEGMPRKRLSSMNYGSEDPVLKVVHSRMKLYLNQQEEMMEQRIKKFEEQQRMEFTKLQKHAHEERRRLFIAIDKSRDSGATEMALPKEKKISNKPEVKPTTNPVTMGFNVPSAMDTKRTKDANTSSKVSAQKLFAPTKQFENKKELDSTINNMLEDDDGLFTFDEELKQPSPEYQGKPSDSTPFGLSSDDDDDSSTDGSSFHDDPVMKRVPSSLPMAMPMFMRLKEEEYCGSVDDQIDPSEVAKSIQQLALSVQDTGMFGDLPKPRINSRR